MEGQDDPGRTFALTRTSSTWTSDDDQSLLGALNLVHLQFQGCQIEDNPLRSLVSTSYQYFMSILVGLVMICVGWSVITYPRVAQMIAKETQEAIMDLPNAGSNQGDAHDEQQPQPPQQAEAGEEVQDDAMEFEPEGLQGIWADQGPPRARGRGPARERASKAEEVVDNFNKRLFSST